jgi:HlyD family secretion protein
MKVLPVAAIAAIPLGIAVMAFIAIEKKHAARADIQLISGTIEATHIDASSKIPGRIDSLFVGQGDFVAKGQKLFRLESKEMDAKLEQARGAMEAAEARVRLVKSGARPQEKDAALKLYNQSKIQTDMLDKTLNRIRKLHADSIVSSQELDQVEAQFNAAREQMDAAKAKYDMAVEGARAEDLDAAKSIAYQAKNAYNEVMAYRQELLICSALNGEVEKIISHAGEIISGGYPVMTILDTSDFWVVVQVKETGMSPFRKGAVFKGMVPGLGGAQFEFRVAYLAPMADFATWRPTNQRGEFDVRTFEIHLRPVSAIPGLRPGMTVNFTVG